MSVSGVRHVSYDPVSGSLITSHPTSNGLTYTVESYQYLADLDPAQLEAAPPVAITSSLHRYPAAAEVGAGQRVRPGPEHHGRSDHRIRQSPGPAELLLGPGTFTYSLNPPDDGYGI